MVRGISRICKVRRQRSESGDFVPEAPEATRAGEAGEAVRRWDERGCGLAAGDALGERGVPRVPPR
jgi:hypothetical protein